MAESIPIHNAILAVKPVWRQLQRNSQWDDVVATFLALLVTVYVARARINGKGPHFHLWFERPQVHLDSKKAVAETNIARVLSESGKDVVIFFGSQSGTAQRLAYHLGQVIDRRFSKQVLVVNLSDYDSSSIAMIERQTLVIFVLSTFGEGDPPDNAFAFSDWLTSSPPQNCLEGMRFAMLGLGSSKYLSYNQFAKQANEALLKFGAQPILDLCLADDAFGMVDEDFFNWSTDLFTVFVEKLNIAEQARPYTPALKIEFLDESTTDDEWYMPLHGSEVQKATRLTPVSSINCLPVKNIRMLTESRDRMSIHIDIDISRHVELKYNTGDHIAVWPENTDDEVESLRVALGIPQTDMKKRLNIVGQATGSWNPTWGSTSIHASLKRRMEIAAPVSREVIRDLEQFAPSDAAKSALRSISRDKETYTRHRASKKVTLASILHHASPDCPWKIPLSFLLERVPALKPRYYSIASASTVQPRLVSLTVSVTTLQLDSPNEIIHGLTSYYLLSMLNSPKGPSGVGMPSDALRTAYCHFRKSKFRAPVSPSQPMVMVATGSGIAPFRGFIQHIVKQFELGKEIGSMVLFFGCRAPEEQLYKEEFQAAEKTLCGRLRIIISYSRAGTDRGYIQDKIKRKHELLGQLLVDEDANIYICGSLKMSQDVQKVLRDILCRRQQWTNSEFTNFEAMKRRTKRWQEDVWG
ncbi:hypothetical protein BGZ61DRAFT_539196 [Ilyonectria robusta]|uniref:uncharacterized protein n=1 Tax=Ilyonectria robusta TaxID=1079257 RepID=UPI001E8D515F|nr:uncharacterized protein BGZ61DRAFT_539196 [Ilyonectria robusta]KAH8663899.1 hypothetical protein BGZ61DRAFT_539196 [Ilyonectria robusta]